MEWQQRAAAPGLLRQLPTGRLIFRFGRSPATGNPPRRIAETDFSAPQVCGQAPAGRCLGIPETTVTD
jgi:hypothetical protein